MPKKRKRVGGLSKNRIIYVQGDFIKVHTTIVGLVDNAGEFYELLPDGHYVRVDNGNGKDQPKIILEPNPKPLQMVFLQDGSVYQYQTDEAEKLALVLIAKPSRFVSLSPSKRSGAGKRNHASTPGW